MGVPLERAWQVCRILDERDLATDWDNEVARAMVLTNPEPAPTISAPPRPAAPPPAARALPPTRPPERKRAAPPPPAPKRAPGKTIADRDPAAAERIASRRRRRLGA